MGAIEEATAEKAPPENGKGANINNKTVEGTTSEKTEEARAAGWQKRAAIPGKPLI